MSAAGDGRRDRPPGHPVGDEYQARFDALAAAGRDVHGEADLVHALLDGVRSRILDAGCGTGRVGIELARRGHDVVGTDRDPAMLATARRRAPELPWVEADLAALDLAGVVDPPAFDAVVLAGNVPLFVDPDTQPAVLRRVAAHLRPSGFAVLGFSLGRGYEVGDLDRDAAAAGLRTTNRWSTWDRSSWTVDDDYAVSVLRPG